MSARSRAQVALSVAPEPRLPPAVGRQPPAQPPRRLGRRPASRSPRRRDRADLPPLLATPDQGNLIGRSEEQARLRALWDESRGDESRGDESRGDESRGGELRLALVGGEPGAGKTRLARELARIANGDGAQVLFGQCRPEGATPYEPVVGALADPVAELSDSWLRAHAERHGPALARLLPPVAARLPELARARDSSASPTRLHAGVAAVLAELARRSPVLIILEDLHWATRSTVRLVRHLVEQGPRMPVLVLATYRDGAVDPSHPMAELLARADDGTSDRVVLEGLSQREVSGFLVDRLAAAGVAGSRLATILWNVTQGNPLFMSEVIRDLVETGIIVGGQVQNVALAQMTLPADLDEAVVRRLGRCPELVREALEVASVLGDEFAVAGLREVLAAKDDALRAALLQARAAGFLRDSPREGSWVFAHSAFREALYRSLAPNRRVRLHDRVAALLDHSPGPGPDAVEPALLTHHYVAAAPVGGSEKALRHAIRAAERAAAVMAFDEAADHYGQALAMLGGATGATAVRCDLLLDLGEAYRQAGEPTRARQAVIQAAFGARAGGDGARLARATLALGQLHDVWGADAELIGLLERALAATRDDSALQAQLLGRLAQARAAIDNPNVRKARCDRAWELAWDSRDPATMGAVLLARHEALTAPDDLEDRIEAAGELLAMAGGGRDDSLALRAHGWRFVDLMEHGRWADADHDLAAHGHLARQASAPDQLARNAAWAAARALLKGDRRRAVALIDRAHALGDQAGDPDARAVYWAQQWGLLLDWGSPSDLEELVPVWRDLVRAHDGSPSWQARFALLLAGVDRHGEAAAIVEDLCADGCAEVPLDRSWLATVAFLAEAAATVGAVAESKVLGRLLAPYARRHVVVEGGWLFRGSVARAAGLAALTAGRRAEADRHFATAVETHQRLGGRPSLARARFDWGSALVHQGEPGDRIRGHDLLNQAADDAEQVAMRELAIRARMNEAASH